MAQASASRMVDLPAPLGPMIPVSPARKVISVSACWRKLRIRRERRRMAQPSSAVRSTYATPISTSRSLSSLGSRSFQSLRR